ncbi:protein-lysine methyltransferase METTL21C [Oreochromis niloticus]|uniref:protein-lysine methyltransferase METTL21C n=1 Tax=Oreochromis niloticus TaxID=8128 RepID=UPI000905B72A|nr:protein-lysine methyltransferase METTL21C [Oreochromis niloticus]
MLEDERENEKEGNTECEEEETMEEVLADEKAQPEDTDSIVAGSSALLGQEIKKQTALKENWIPSIVCSLTKDIYHYVGEDIVIYESIDSFGAMMWPAALALCSFLENNRHMVNLKGKEVLELGAGTGLVTIVASLLGASVTATDLPEMLGNLRANVMRNTRNRCRHTPQVVALPWSYDLERTHPSSVYHYDYILAADVVYHHNYLGELLVTMKHFCKLGTTLIWANKVRFESDLTFTENFKKAFNTSLLAEDGEMKIFMATSRD